MSLEIFDWIYTVEPEYTKVSDLIDMKIGDSKLFLRSGTDPSLRDLTLDDENINSACSSHEENKKYRPDIFFCDSRLTVKKIGRCEWEVYFWWDNQHEFPTRNLEVHDVGGYHDAWYDMEDFDLEHLDWKIGWKGPMIPWEKVINLLPVYFSSEDPEDFD